MNGFLRHLVVAAGLLLAFTSIGSAAEPKHRVVIQVDQNDPHTMDLALNNATDVIEYYRSTNQAVAVEIMACGPGLHMLRDDTSPVKDRVKHAPGDRVPRQDPVLGLQQHQAGHGEEGRPSDRDAARNDDRAPGRGAADGVAGTGLELCAAVGRRAPSTAMSRIYTNVVPTKGGTHTQRGFGLATRLILRVHNGAGGYASLRSQGRPSIGIAADDGDSVRRRCALTISVQAGDDALVTYKSLTPGSRARSGARPP